MSDLYTKLHVALIKDRSELLNELALVEKTRCRLKAKLESLQAEITASEQCLVSHYNLSEGAAMTSKRKRRGLRASSPAFGKASGSASSPPAAGTVSAAALLAASAVRPKPPTLGRPRAAEAPLARPPMIKKIVVPVSVPMPVPTNNARLDDVVMSSGPSASAGGDEDEDTEDEDEDFAHATKRRRRAAVIMEGEDTDDDEDM